MERREYQNKIKVKKNEKKNNIFKSNNQFSNNIHEINISHNFGNFLNEKDEFNVEGVGEEFSDISKDNTNEYPNKSNHTKNINKFSNIKNNYNTFNNNDENKSSNNKNKTERNLKKKLNESKSINSFVNKKLLFSKNIINEEKDIISNNKKNNIRRVNSIIENNINQKVLHNKPIIKHIKTNSNEYLNNEIDNNKINENDFKLNKNKAIDLELNKNETYTNFNIYNKKLFQSPENKYKKRIVNKENKKNISIKKKNNDKIFNNINIFNSTLIMLINITFTKKFCFNKEKYEKIKICENNIEYCLSSILYHLAQIAWHGNNNDFCEKDLFEKYNNFITYFTSSLNKNKKKYLYEIKNIGFIINYIYSRINQDLTKVKNNNNIMIDGENNLSKFKNEFKKNNYSFISDHFIGFFQYIIKCENCKLINDKEYKNNSEYNYFYILDFDLVKVNDFYQKNNLEINKKNIINLDKCFNYLLYEKYKNNIMCELCSTNNKSQTFSIFSFPNILTIVLYNNENCIFDLKDTININKYTKNPKESDYFLISILCQHNYTRKFILYCYNYKYESWFCYEDKKIYKISKMNINAVPLALVYQIANTMDFEYHNLKIEDKLSLFVDYTNGVSKLINFHKNYTCKYAYEKVALYFNFPKDKIILFNNAMPLDKNAVLSSKLKNGDRMMVIQN